MQTREEDRGYVTPCEVWQGSTNADGYGIITVDGRRWLAHRYIWSLLVGPPPPQLHHRCEVKPCVRLDHLQPVGARAHQHLHRLGKPRVGGTQRGTKIGRTGPRTKADGTPALSKRYAHLRPFGGS